MSRAIFSAFLLLCVAAAACADVWVERGKESGLMTWEWRHAGISLRLVQRHPDQTRAYMLARGFSREQANRIARACLFGSMFRNDGMVPLDFDLDEWRVLHEGDSRSLVTREEWAQRLPKGASPDGARIALRWSLLPTRQHFEPGDYNWGMTSYGLAPGEHFDLQIRLRVGGEPLKATIPDLECAPENLQME